MTVIEVVPFDFEGKKYEVGVWSDGAKVYVQTFHEGKPANGYRSEVGFIDAFDFRKLKGHGIIKEFIEIAKDDIKTRRYERLLEAIESLKKQ
ncbi:MAG: hypothetical protein WBW55_04285 [Desulfobaccales bacterium]